MVPNSVSYCRAKPFKVLAAAPRPREKGRFRVAILDRPPSPSWDLRLPEIGTRARTSQYAYVIHVIRVLIIHRPFLEFLPVFWALVFLLRGKKDLIL